MEPMHQRDRAGFTIVELVIVMAVLAVLASVLIPAFTGIVGRAHAAAALQEARNALSQTLAMSETGSLSEGTRFYVLRDDGGEARVDAVFEFRGQTLRRLEQGAGDRMPASTIGLIVTGGSGAGPGDPRRGLADVAPLIVEDAPGAFHVVSGTSGPDAGRAFLYSGDARIAEALENGDIGGHIVVLVYGGGGTAAAVGSEGPAETVAEAPAVHTVAVIGGTAVPSSAAPGTEVALSPVAAPAGQLFDSWEATSPVGLTLAGDRFTMPDAEVSVRARYRFQPPASTGNGAVKGERGRIVGTTAAMEYALRGGLEGRPNSHAAWTRCGEGVTNVGAGNYWVRLRADGTTAASDPVLVGVTHLLYTVTVSAGAAQPASSVANAAVTLIPPDGQTGVWRVERTEVPHDPVPLRSDGASFVMPPFDVTATFTPTGG